MEAYQIQLIQTAVVIIAIILIRSGTKFSLNRAKNTFGFQKDRVKFTLKITTSMFYLSGAVAILLIWGVSKGELALYLSSILAVIGIALFAQWSMLSNITASVLLFLNHPAKIGDTIMILDKEFPLTGKIKDVGAFFLTFKTEDNEIVTIPNGLIFQKMVKIISQD
ncbi:MAG: mechanosensitive ion channel [Putridiphycobacter sp.]|nr:mechanosensitive ion channel [Putridiphycobacter sp.]